jgi:GNAT superfamily N-acetyltransferase
MLIRPATPADAAAIARVDVASWRAAYQHIMPDTYLDGLSVEEKAASWAARIAREQWRGKRTLVAEDPALGVIGYATVGPDPGSDDGMLLLMYVLPDRWRIGIGRALMQAAADALRMLGYKRAVLSVLEANERARRFYESEGWAPDGTSRSDDYGGARLVALQYAIDL